MKEFIGRFTWLASEREDFAEDADEEEVCCEIVDEQRLEVEAAEEWLVEWLPALSTRAPPPPTSCCCC